MRNQHKYLFRIRILYAIIGILLLVTLFFFLRQPKHSSARPELATDISFNLMGKSENSYGQSGSGYLLTKTIAMGEGINRKNSLQKVEELLDKAKKLAKEPLLTDKTREKLTTVIKVVEGRKDAYTPQEAQTTIQGLEKVIATAESELAELKEIAKQKEILQQLVEQIQEIRGKEQLSDSHKNELDGYLNNAYLLLKNDNAKEIAIKELIQKIQAALPKIIQELNEKVETEKKENEKKEKEKAEEAIRVIEKNRHSSTESTSSATVSSGSS